MNLSSSLGAGWASSLTVLCEDGERVLCRGWRDDGDGDRTAVLAVLYASEHPTPGFIDRPIQGARPLSALAISTTFLSKMARTNKEQPKANSHLW
jgi:hypothetical protein